jgi:hypothetical protein
VVRREHRPEHRRDGVEGVVRERERLGVSLHELDGEAFGLGSHACALEERGHVVDADDVAAEPRGPDRRVAAAGRDVEHAPARVKVGVVDEPLRDERHPGRDHGEVAARPRLLLLLLDGREVWPCVLHRLGHVCLPRRVHGRSVRIH